MSREKPLLLSVRTTANLLGVSVPTVHRMIASGSLPLAPLCGRRKLRVTDVEKIVGTSLTPNQIAAAEAAARP